MPRGLKPLAMTIHTAFVSDHFHVKILFQKIFVRFSFLKRFIEVEALLGLSKALIRLYINHKLKKVYDKLTKKKPW